jgi:hypothetical protein
MPFVPPLTMRKDGIMRSEVPGAAVAAAAVAAFMCSAPALSAQSTEAVEYHSCGKAYFDCDIFQHHRFEKMTWRTFPRDPRYLQTGTDSHECQLMGYHGVCGYEESPILAWLAALAARGDAAGLLRAGPLAPEYVIVNRARGTIQLRGCVGEGIMANLRLEPAQLSSAAVVALERAQQLLPRWTLAARAALPAWSLAS